jgi:Putative restriction endonuclease
MSFAPTYEVPTLEPGDHLTRIEFERRYQASAHLYAPGRGARVDDDGYVAGAPELVVEVAHTSASYDLHAKKRAYQRNGVGTYLVHVVQERELRWFELVDGQYVLRTPASDGILRSSAFPGLWLDVPAAVRGDVAAVLEVLARGIAEEGDR